MLPKDPILLLSYVNTRLRDYYTSLDALCEDLDIDKAFLIDTLKTIAYDYDETLNQFK